MRTYSLMRRSVKVATGKSSKYQHTFTVPANVARMVLDAGIKEFTVVLTADGILYRPVRTEPEASPLPEWLRKERA